MEGRKEEVEKGVERLLSFPFDGEWPGSCSFSNMHVTACMEGMPPAPCHCAAGPRMLDVRHVRPQCLRMDRIALDWTGPDISSQEPIPVHSRGRCGRGLA